MPWVKGQSGNPNGRPRKQHALADLLRIAGNRKEEGDNRPRKKALAETLWRLAINGDVGAARLILEYVDGKPAQIVQHEGGDSPLTLLVEYVNDWHEEDSATDTTPGPESDPV